VFPNRVSRRGPATPTCFAFWLLLTVGPGGCSPRGASARNPGNPTPVADPASGPGTYAPPRANPASSGAGGLPKTKTVPLRPDQAPLVSIQQVLDSDSLLGRRVRVPGRCTAAGAGPRAGSWTLEEAGSTIEVRGLVPSSCSPSSTRDLTIFAQIEPKAAGSKDRLLLRLPD
jgi:hypothetical protein